MPRAALDMLVASTTAKSLPAKSLASRSIWRRALRLLKSIAARIDLSNFPPSCCG